jgi:hypothetical protein
MVGQPGRSGGDRPTAPQNNPANVNPLGGDGQSGQANPNYTGFGYGQNGALEAQAGAAKMEKANNPAPTGAPAPASMASMFGGLMALDAESQDSLPISDGVDVGRGRGSEALPPSLNSDTRITENADLMKRYLPDLIDAARLPGAPDSYKRLVNYVKARLI